MTLGAARVRWYTNDMSGFVDATVTGYVIMVLQTERGPVGIPQIVDSQVAYSRKFGRKVPWTTDPLIAEMALRENARLIIIRACSYVDVHDPTSITAKTSKVVVNDRGAVPLPASITGSATGPYVFIQAASGKVQGTEVGPFTIGFEINDKLMITVGQGDDQLVTLSPGTSRPAATIVEEINEQTEGLTASVLHEKIVIQANNLEDSITIHDIANGQDAYSTLGLGIQHYPANEGTDKLVIRVNEGTDQGFRLVPIDRSTGSFSLSSSQVATQLAPLLNARAYSVGGKLRLVTSQTGNTRSIQIREDSTAATTLGFDMETHFGYSGEAQATLTFESKDPGSWGNHLRIQISDSVLKSEDHFSVKVIYGLQGELTETYTDLSMDPESKYYAPNYINERSDLVKVTDERSENVEPANRPAVNLFGYPMTGGSDGDPMKDSDWIGSPVFQTGMYAIDKVWNLSMDFMIPGTNSVTVYNAMTAYAESRQDLVAYGAVPANMTPEEAVDWRLGNAPWSHPAFNSHRFALFYGMPLVYDDMDDTRKHINCLGHLAAVICRNDNNHGEHIAFVGAKRGTVTLMEGIDFNVQSYRSTGYADLFAEHGINYLFISKMQGIEGGMFWEQRTTQRDASSTRNLNVVRLITMMNRSLLPILWLFLFDPNHPVTWRQVYRELLPAFEDWKAKYKIFDFAVQCDEMSYFSGGELKNAVLNSGLDIARGIYNARALIQATEAITYLDFTLGLTRAGDAFEQFNEIKTLPGYIRA